ncbi:nephrin-like [Mytilus edulis]|uniref:nephrin-like n=1 Tax=Mytilus edulis TaxID=6550 RepID=UPI0039EE829C
MLNGMSYLREDKVTEPVVLNAYDDVDENVERHDDHDILPVTDTQVATAPYEVLGRTDQPNAYEDLTPEEDILPVTDSQVATAPYEVLGRTDQPNAYEDLNPEKDAPDITVNNHTYTQNDADRTVTCNPSGNPDSYTYHKWQHRSRYGDLIREFGGSKTLLLPDVSVSMRYQDSGEYVGIAINGIKGKDNKLEQNGSGCVTVNDRFLTEIYAVGTGSLLDPFQQYVKQGHAAVLQCIYERERMKWHMNGTIIASENIVINSTKYKVSVTSSGLYYRLHVLNVQPDDELIYSCRVPPSRIYFHGSMDNKLEGTEGTDLLIRCIADGGKPPPDVSILNGTRPNKQQEVSYTIPKISRDNHQRTIVCQATSDALDNPMTTIGQIYLNLKPLTTIFNTNEVSTEETVPLRVSCTSYGSRPAATFRWIIGENDVTSSSTTLQPVRESNDTNTVTSTLASSVDRTHNKQSVICIASNIVGSVSGNKTLDVKYAPDITVNSPTYTQNDAIRTVTCNPSGNPDSYIYHKWQQKSKYGEIIREFAGNKTFKLPDVPVGLRHQDSGEYVCTASNGIKDKFNKLEQKGYGLVSVNAQPVFTSDTIDRVKQFGEIDKDVDIYVDVYSVPKFTSYIWTREGTPITTQTSAKYQSSSYLTIVKDTFHGKEVQLDGYNLTLTIHDLEANDFSNYTVTLKSVFPGVKFTIELESASVPDIPGNFSQGDSAFTSFTVQWDPGSGAGYEQLFYIQYRVQGSSEWTTVQAVEEDVNKPRRRRTYEVRNLQEGKAYELRMYAENTAMKRSNFTDVLIVFTKSSGAKVSTTSSAVTGAVVGVVVTLVIVCASFIVILLIKRSQVKDKKEKNDKLYVNPGFQNIQNGDEYEEVENKFDVEHPQSSKTYETLGTKEKISVYDDLVNSKGETSSKSSMGVYEALGVQETPSIYAKMKNQKEQKQLNTQHESNKVKKPNDHSDSMELNTTQERSEKVYENEVF